MKTTPERLGEAFEQARRHWRHRRPGETLEVAHPAVQPRLTIAISRESGAGGGEIARAVGTRLDWPVYDRELLQKIAEEMGLRTELLESVDEKQSNWILESLAAFADSRRISSAGFAQHLAETLLALAAHGDCILVGRGAGVILPESTTLRVRLVAPLKARIARMRQKSGISENEAARRVDQTDAQRKEFVSSHFHKDVSDVHHCDLLLNTARFSTDQCADLIVAALRQLEGTLPMQLPPQAVTP